MQVGAYKVMVKPALVVLVLAVIIGAMSPLIAKFISTVRPPDYGYIHPERWKFETRGGAEATLQMSSAAGQKNLIRSKAGYFNINSDEGFTIDIQKTGKTPDTVYMRNALNLSQTKESDTLNFSFEARSAKPFVITYIIRDGLLTQSRLLWSKSFTVSGDWQTYSAPVALGDLQERAHLLNCVISAHLGSQTGTLGMRKMYLR